jgi:hypothetical protein
MKVIPYEDCRFFVTSETDPEKRYLVDCAEMKCDCINFQTRIGPRRAQGEKVMCKHMLAVTYWLGFRVMKDMAARYHQQQAA